MIYIITGPVQSGKTTAALDSIKGKNYIGGFLSPDKSSLRKIYFPREKEFINFQVQLDQVSKFNDNNLLEIGKFHFLKDAFAEATKRTLSQQEAQDISCIMVDEIGKLELKEEGFHKLIIKLLSLDWTQKNLILFVRDYLLDEVIEFYQIQNVEILTKEKLKEIL